MPQTKRQHAAHRRNWNRRQILGAEANLYSTIRDLELQGTHVSPLARTMVKNIITLLKDENEAVWERAKEKIEKEENSQPLPF